MRWLTTEQVAQQMEVSSNTVRRWVADRGLPYSNIGAPGPKARVKLRFTQDDLDAWVKRQNQAA